MIFYSHVNLLLSYKHTMEHHSAIKPSGILIHATILMNFDNVMLSERRQAQTATYCMIELYEMSRKGKTIKTEDRFMVA